MSKAKPTVPRATIHKQILDVAADNRDAPIDTLADEVSGATPGLVERVLDEYGDPGAHATAPSPTTDSTTPADRTAPADGTEENPTAEPTTDPTPPAIQTESLTETQLETLRAVYEDPDATQAALAAEFDITSASINQRLNSIDGFEWGDRRAFVEALWGPNDRLDPKHQGENANGTAEVDDENDTAEVDDENDTADVVNENDTADKHARAIDSESSPTGPQMTDQESAGEPSASEPTDSPAPSELGHSTAEQAPQAASGDLGHSTGDAEAAEPDVSAQLSAIQDELTALADVTQRLAAAEQTDTQQTASAESDSDLPAALIHKVAHACLQSEQFSEAEELQVLRALVS